MPRLATIICFLMVLLFCSGQSLAGGYKNVSLVNLIVRPEDFVGENIRVKGYLRLGIYFAVYPAAISAEMADVPSAIRVVDDTEMREIVQSCNDMYVVIRGRFILEDHFYKIADISDVHNAKNMEPCWVDDPN